MPRASALALALVLMAAAPSAAAQAGEGGLLDGLLSSDDAEDGDARGNDGGEKREAKDGRGPGDRGGAKDGAPLIVPSTPSAVWDGAPAAVGGAVLLLLALVLGHHARKPVTRKPARRSFEAGLARGRAVRAGSEEEARAALARTHVGRVRDVALLAGGVRVVVQRGRGVACEHAAGYLAGLYEGAWARDVRVAHPVCGGRRRQRPCTFDVQPAARVSGPGSPEEAAWTRA